MVRANKPVKFQQSSFFGNGNSKLLVRANRPVKFQPFQDIVVPVIANNDI